MADDRTQFLIDMAAKLTGGEASAVSLADLGEKMLAAGATAAELDVAVKRTSAALEGSATAFKSASDAVALGESKYRQMEASADRAAKAVERIGAASALQAGKLAAVMQTGDTRAIERAEQKLAALGERHREAVDKARLASSALAREAVVLDALTTKAGGAATAHANLSKGLANLKNAATEAARAEAKIKGSGKVNEIAEAFGKLGGPMGRAGQQAFGLATGFAKLGAGIGSLGPYVAAAAVFVAVATGAALAAAGVAKWSVSLADANRTAQLLTAGVAGTVEGGAELDATINRLGATVPATREELLSMASGLRKSGLEGAALSAALEDAAVEAATLKFGPEFGKQMLALDQQSKRFSANLAGTFGGLKIEKLLGGFQKLIALFDVSTESGATMKFLFESIFQPMIDGAAAAMPKIERLFLHMEILALKAFIALKPWSDEIAFVGKLLLFGAAVVGGVLLVALGLVAAAIAGVVLGLTLAGAAFGAVIYAVYKFVDVVSDVIVGLITDFSGYGGRLIQGFVDGITAGGAAVVKAVTGVVGGGIAAAKNLLGIASPSKVFAGIGDFTAQGFAEGVEGGSGDARSALEDMVAPPKAGGAGEGGGAKFGGVVINIHISGRGESDDGIVAKFREVVLDIFEGDALAMGGGEAAT